MRGKKFLGFLVKKRKTTNSAWALADNDKRLLNLQPSFFQKYYNQYAEEKMWRDIYQKKMFGKTPLLHRIYMIGGRRIFTEKAHRLQIA